MFNDGHSVIDCVVRNLSVTGAAQAAYAARMHGIDPATRGGIVDLAPIIAAHRPQRRAVRDL